MIKKQNRAKSNQVKVTFVVDDYDEMGRVCVVGDFNNWTPQQHNLVRRSNRTRSASVDLPAGKRYAFRYVEDGGNWFNDEAADGWEPNGYGTDNCVILT